MFIIYASHNGQDAFLQRAVELDTLKKAARTLIGRWLRETECTFPESKTKLVIAKTSQREEVPLLQARLGAKKPAWKPYMTPEEEAVAQAKTQALSLKRAAGRAAKEKLMSTHDRLIILRMRLLTLLSRLVSGDLVSITYGDRRSRESTSILEITYGPTPLGQAFTISQLSKVDKHKHRTEPVASVVVAQVIRQIEFFEKTKLPVMQSEHNFELEFDFISTHKKRPVKEKRVKNYF